MTEVITPDGYLSDNFTYGRSVFTVMTQVRMSMRRETGDTTTEVVCVAIDSRWLVGLRPIAMAQKVGPGLSLFDGRAVRFDCGMEDPKSFLTALSKAGYIPADALPRLEEQHKRLTPPKGIGGAETRPDSGPQ